MKHTNRARVMFLVICHFFIIIHLLTTQHISIKIISLRKRVFNIPQYKLNKLFEKFYRVNDPRDSRTGGAGLGLAITKQIIELHQVKIYVKNDNDEYIEL